MKSLQLPILGLLGVSIAISPTGIPGGVRLQDNAQAPPDHSTGVQPCQVVPTEEEATLPEGGRTEENTYINDFYGFSYQFPKGWFVDKGSIQDEAKQKEKHATRPDPNDKIAYAGWMMIQCHHLLLEVSKDPENEPCSGVSRVGIPNISLNINDLAMWENLKPAEGSSIGANESPNEEESGQVIFGPTKYIFDGQLFARADVKQTLPPVLDSNMKTMFGERIIYVASIEGTRANYRILFNIVAESPQQLEELFQTLNSLKFRQ